MQETVEITCITPFNSEITIEVPEDEVDETFDDLSDNMPAVYIENEGR